MSANVGSAPSGSGNQGDTNLLLYYNEYSFYSQKVVMAFHEKNLSFKSHIVNLIKSEQYDSSFLKINPRGEVPVLEDNGKIIPDSSRIIEYLEDNYTFGNNPKLMPTDEGAETRANAVFFKTIIEQIPIGIVTMGSFFHTDLVDTPKVPFIAPVRKQMANAEKNSSDVLREIAAKNPDAKVVLTEKADFQDKKHQIVINKEEYLGVLSQVEEVLIKVEDELRKHTGEKENWWLISDKFTVVDISLTILLERLNQLGYDTRFWANGKRPIIEQYYKRVQERDSYKKTIPTKLDFAKTIIMSQSPAVLGGLVAGIVVVVGLGKKLLF